MDTNQHTGLTSEDALDSTRAAGEEATGEKTFGGEADGADITPEILRELTNGKGADDHEQQPVG